MGKAVLEHPKLQHWVNQFSEADRADAAVLAALIKIVPADVFRRDLTACLQERLDHGDSPIALYNESERRKRKGVPNRLFGKDSVRASRTHKGKKSVRAIGKTGPALVPRQRNVAEEVGSEGVVANIITQFHRTNRKTILVSPGPDVIRDRRVRRFILVTDFIGSGDRVISYLNAAWRHPSVRSWWSRRATGGLKFEVVAYAGTEDGVAAVSKHTMDPIVTLVAQCPTIDSVFLPAKRKVIKSLCERYAVAGSRPLGYGDAGALIAFDHGMPNNAPAVLWKGGCHWSALVPERTIRTSTSPFQDGLTDDQEKARIETAARVSTSGPSMSMTPTGLSTIVLSTLRRSPRHPEALSGRLGLRIDDVIDALDQLKRWGWINDSHQLTERGRTIASRLIRQDRKRPLPSPKESMYFPKSLRAPRNV